MKGLLILFFVASCASKNPDWDSGAQRQQNDSDEQKMEQRENTNNQFTIPGRW